MTVSKGGSVSAHFINLIVKCQRAAGRVGPETHVCECVSGEGYTLHQHYRKGPENHFYGHR